MPRHRLFHALVLGGLGLGAGCGKETSREGGRDLAVAAPAGDAATGDGAVVSDLAPSRDSLAWDSGRSCEELDPEHKGVFEGQCCIWGGKHRCCL